MDWFTFAAQIVNFLVLVGLLRWLLYDRILDAMKQREDKIASRLEEAERERETARQRQQQYEEKAAEIDRRRDQLLGEARETAEEERKRMRDEARQEIDKQRQRWQEAFRRDRDDLLAYVRQQAGQVGLKAARRMLSELADEELESQMCRTFASQLKQLDQEQREEISHHLGNGESQVEIRTALDIPKETREQLREAVRENFQYEGEIEFQQAAELVCGLELDVGGYTFSWNVRDFLDDVEREFERQIQSAG